MSAVSRRLPRILCVTTVLQASIARLVYKVLLRLLKLILKLILIVVFKMIDYKTLPRTAQQISKP